MATRQRLPSKIIGCCRTLARHVRGLLEELDYAQRRLLEIRTGYVFTAEEHARRTRAEIRRLEQLLDPEPGERPSNALERPV